MFRNDKNVYFQARRLLSHVKVQTAHVYWKHGTEHQIQQTQKPLQAIFTRETTLQIL